MERYGKVCVGGTRVRASIDLPMRPSLTASVCVRLWPNKCAWAKLPWYGAKAVIDADSSDLTEDNWDAYARVLNRLEGTFLTATDTGTSIKDMEYLKTMTPYVSTIDTADATAYVIVSCINTVAGSMNIRVDSILIQGIGKVGSLVAGVLYKLRPSCVFVCDIDESRSEYLKKLDPKVFRVTSPDDMDMKVDYFVPCSSGPVVTRNNASYIKASVIFGAANNQLESDDLAELLHGRGIVYVPDFIANSGGLLKVAMSSGIVSSDSLDSPPRKLEALLLKSKSFDRSLLFLAKDQCRKRIYA